MDNANWSGLPYDLINCKISFVSRTERKLALIVFDIVFDHLTFNLDNDEPGTFKNYIHKMNPLWLDVGHGFIFPCDPCQNWFESVPLIRHTISVHKNMYYTGFHFIVAHDLRILYKSMLIY